MFHIHVSILRNFGSITCECAYLYIYINTDVGLVVGDIALIVVNAVGAGITFGAKIFVVRLAVGEI